MTDVQPVESPRKQPRKLKEPVALPPAIDPKTYYEAAVAEVKQIGRTADTDQMRVGQIAAQVETTYGEETLSKFAKDTGIALCTLRRRRSVWRAWEKIKAAPPKLYSVAEALQAHPDAAQIIKDNPNITSREARKKAHEHNKQTKQKDPESRLKEYRKYLENAVKHAYAVKTDAEIVDDNLDKERRQILRKAIEPKVLGDLRDSANALLKLVNFLQRLVDEGDDAQK
jgi:hypothetical protein